MICFTHAIGNSNSRAALAGLQHYELLSHFFTTVAVFPDSFSNSLSSLPGLGDFKRRQYSNQIQRYTTTQPMYELIRLFCLKMSFHSLVQHEKGIFSTDKIIQRLDRKISQQLLKGSISKIKAVYAYEDGARETFIAAHQRGLKNFYDLPIGYWRAAVEYLNQEKERWPEWACTISAFRDSEDKLRRKDEEIELADTIMVASSFTASTLEKYPGSSKNIHIIPYGFPNVYEGTRKYYNGLDRKLKLLYVGGLTQRKGIADIFSVVDSLSDEVTLTIVGQKTTNDCDVLNDCLKRHTYIPSLPNNQILKLMRSHDVLLFPSLFEGFGLVITEAMSQGMPVITTNRTAGPDIIQHNKNGWLIQAADTKSLTDAVKFLLDNPNIIEENGRSALETASKRPWWAYGRSLAETIISELK